MKLWKSKKPIVGCVPGKSAALKQDQQQQQQQQQQDSFNGHHHPPTDTALAPMLSGKCLEGFSIFPRFSNILSPAHSLPIPAIVSRIENLPKAPNMCAPIFRFSDFPLFPAHSGLSHFRPRCLRTALKCPTLDIDLYTNIRRRICIFISKYRLAGALLKI